MDEGEAVILPVLEASAELPTTEVMPKGHKEDRRKISKGAAINQHFLNTLSKG